jgi:hypothetical protein
MTTDTRDQLIRRIEATYPPDAPDADRAALGTFIMAELLAATPEHEQRRRDSLFKDAHSYLAFCDPAAVEEQRLHWRPLPTSVLIAMVHVMESDQLVQDFALRASWQDSVYLN